ncbi:MAG TPA: YciI family protein [Candidatus Limnocylindria bacterium]|jgi:hypothetical protein|nr:YciI family protein [Candidatus Limnocylindria bacterium]
MPHYMLMFVGSDEWRSTTPKEQMERAYAEIGKWWQDLENKGVIKGGEELSPGHTATSVKRVNGSMRVTDGPFLESKESVGGYAVIEVNDLDEAIAIAKSWPGGDVEVRPTVER